jgi:hypothetical protein
MLNKIENINLKPEMRNEIKSSRKESGFNKVYKKENFADTLTYSAALIYISHLNWKLKKFNVSSEELIDVEFQYENYTFNFLVNTKSPAVKDIPVKISDYGTANYSNVNRFILDVSFNHRTVNFEFINYEVLNNIFSKIKTFFIPGESEVNSTYYFNILNGFEDKLCNLLSQIYLNIISFIEKLNNKKIVLGSEDLSVYSGNNLLIKGIHIEY